MQLFSRNKALAALSLGALAALGACGDDVTVPAPVNPPVAVTISPSNANVNVGAFVDLAVAITGGTTTPTLQGCSTSSAAVATAAVQGGNACRVTGVSTGAVTITATTTGGQTAAASVTVNAPVPAISGIAITPAAQNVQVGGTFTITANPTTTAPGATVARNFVSSNTAVATVNATTGAVTAVAPGQATITVTLTGTGTGLSQAVVTGQVAVTVTALPPSVLGVSATPTSAVLVTGGTQQLTATASYASGITGTITYGTSNPGVATVNASGLITAVGPGTAVITVTASSAGNASFGASSATQQVPVTVNAPAQVSIANITQGTTNNPVNINDVDGQIQVQLNLLTNNNVVRSVKLFVCPVSGTCSTTPAAEQTFGTAGAASGSINMFINTADFTVTSDWTEATARYTNGQKNLVAQIETQAATQANNNLAILNFSNDDNFAARHIAPTRAAVAGATSPNANLTYYGGPGAAGRGSITIVPVMYTEGRTVARATSSAACNSYTFVAGTDARPWTITYGADSISATGKDFRCSGVYLSLTANVSAAVDNAQNSLSLPATFATTSSSIPAIGLPATIRADYEAPSVSYALVAPSNGELGWVNGSYNFRRASANDNSGVGARDSSTFSYAYNGCGTTTFTAFTTNTGADIAECGTDFTGGLVSGTDTRGPYTARATAEDLLGNAGTASTDNFGVDKTAPAIRYTAATDSLRIYDGTVVVAPTAGTAADTMFSAQALDERSGLAAGAAQHLLARANQLLNAGSCVVGTAPTAGIGSSFVTAPNCTSSWGSAAFVGSALPDGYLQIASVTYNAAPVAGAEGYWTYRARVTDRAGNRSELGNRQALINTSTPLMTGMGIPGIVTAAGPNAFTPNFSEVVESRLNSFRVTYGTDVYAFPAVATYTLWDNIIGANGNTSVSTPFTSGVNFYTNIQSTLADSTIADSIPAASADTASVRPASVSAAVTNVGGNISSFFTTPLLNANVQEDATAWRDAANSAKGALVRKFSVISEAGETFFSPAGGFKARVVASTNILNSPFDRIDYYYQTATGQPWQFVGSVDAKQAPATSPVAGANVYIADNGTDRVWTYVLRTAVNTNTSLTNTVLSTTTTSGSTTTTTAAITTLPAGCYRAIASKGTSGRVLRTQDYCVAAAPTFRR